MRSLFATSLLALGLVACTGGSDSPETREDVQLTPAEVMELAIQHPRREADKARDQFRNPQATLEFFQIEPGLTVAEIWPGYYTDILAPYYKEVGGQYVAILYPETLSERAAERVAAYKEKYGDTDTYGEIGYGSFSYRDGEKLGEIAPDGTLDRILTFRNVHNWMGGGYAQEAFNDFYAALKPGGMLGVVEHRLPEARMQDPSGRTGYVQESYMKNLAVSAGFEFVGSSEVNANPRDSADHPFGVWTLPPRSRTPEAGSTDYPDFKPELYRNIGESDRATLLFRKPA